MKQNLLEGTTTSEPLKYPQNHPKYRFYGNNIKTMIDVANTWEEGEMKEALNEVLLTPTLKDVKPPCYKLTRIPLFFLFMHRF